jgi:putative tryptophan/tyrosine transport system substrate-binding protein
MKKTFVALIVALITSSVSVEAQQPKRFQRIAVLSASYTSSKSANVQAFRQALHELGYIEGKHIHIEHRNAEGRSERLNELAAELVRLKVDVIVTLDTPGTQVSRKATQTIPIVMTQIGDAVGAGFVESLAKPGGNITGLTQMMPELSGKRLELIKETFPNVARVTVLYDPTNRSNLFGLKEVQSAARPLGLIVQPWEVRGPEDFDRAFSAMARDRDDAFMTIRNPLVGGLYLKRTVELAGKGRLPAMYDGSDYVEAGGLMSYAVNFTDLWRRAATYVDKILKGAKPADLPVEQPRTFELVINLKTAKQIGLTIPPNVLARADKVIK